jgi:Polyketide cyclase / dehydrase and lipid transport
MGLNWAEHSVEIEAPVETCFAAITDYETFPTWQSAVVDTEVLDWDSEGRGKRVRLFVDAKVRKVDYTLDYRYEEPGRIEWDFVEGNGINDADGHYLFEELGDGRTRATYKLGLEVGIPLPGPVARRAHKSTLKASVEDLKREAERRAASSARAVDGAPAKATDGPAAKPRNREPSIQREAELAEKAGIRRPRRAEQALAPEPEDDWSSDGGGHSVAELPALIVGRAASAGRRVAEGGIETARDVSAEAASAGLGVARRAVGLTLKVPSAAANRAARLLGRRSEGDENR